MTSCLVYLSKEIDLGSICDFALDPRSVLIDFKENTQISLNWGESFLHFESIHFLFISALQPGKLLQCREDLHPLPPPPIHHQLPVSMEDIRDFQTNRTALYSPTRRRSVHGLMEEGWRTKKGQEELVRLLARSSLEM